MIVENRQVDLLFINFQSKSIFSQIEYHGLDISEIWFAVALFSTTQLFYWKTNAQFVAHKPTKPIMKKIPCNYWHTHTSCAMNHWLLVSIQRWFCANFYFFFFIFLFEEYFFLWSLCAFLLIRQSNVDRLTVVHMHWHQKYEHTAVCLLGVHEMYDGERNANKKKNCSILAWSQCLYRRAVLFPFRNSSAKWKPKYMQTKSSSIVMPPPLLSHHIWRLLLFHVNPTSHNVRWHKTELNQIRRIEKKNSNQKAKRRVIILTKYRIQNADGEKCNAKI